MPIAAGDDPEAAPSFMSNSSFGRRGDLDRNADLTRSGPVSLTSAVVPKGLHANQTETATCGSSPLRPLATRSSVRSSVHDKQHLQNANDACADERVNQHEILARTRKSIELRYPTTPP